MEVLFLFFLKLSQFFVLILKIFKFLAALGLRCCAWAFSNWSKRGPHFVAVHRLLIVVASPVAEHRLQARGLQQLWLAGPRVQAQQLWHVALVALQHVGSFQTRDQTRVPCNGRWILNHCTTREVPGSSIFLKVKFKMPLRFQMEIIRS